MHPRLAEVMDFVEKKRDELIRSFAGVAPEPMRRRVSDEGWSVAEIIDHLRLVETSVAQVISKRANDARGKGVVGDERSNESVLGSLDHLDLESGRTFMEAPSIVRPQPNVEAAAAIAGLEESRKALRAAAASADGLALGEIKQTHRTFGELDLYQWLVFLGQHEGRHTRQIQRTLKATRAGDGSLIHR